MGPYETIVIIGHSVWDLTPSAETHMVRGHPWAQERGQGFKWLRCLEGTHSNSS